MRPRLAITLGDPRGIGPEIVARTLGAVDADLVLVGPAGTAVPVDVSVGRWAPRGDASTGDASADGAQAGALAGRAIERAVALALDGAVDGIVTAPIDKAALLAGGYDYPGHTEMLAALTGHPTAMMLTSTGPNASGGSHPLRVVLATTHIALRDVVAAVDHAAIATAARITRQYLGDWFGVESPRIALCALNPHAGDGGRFGDEDERILAPAARDLGLVGPLPADTVFVRALRGAFDAVIAPYHDVGMTAIKVASFGHGVNVTLGLPFPRTSPDHGTALDIAGQGIADPSSFQAALRLCADIARRTTMARR